MPLIDEIQSKKDKMDKQYQSSNSSFLRGYTEALAYCLNKIKRSEKGNQWLYDNANKEN